MTARARRLGVTVISFFALASGLLVLPGLAAAATPGYFGVGFTTDNAGWVVGTDATVLATTNGGKAWQTQATTPGGAALLDVCVLPDGKTGWAVGASGTVLRTTDGKSWNKVFSPAFDTSVSYTSVQFVDARTGWIAGGVAAGPLQGTPRGAVLATTDGGATWRAAAVFSGWCPVALEAASTTSAFCAGIQRVATSGGYNTPAVSRTTDGRTWTQPVLPRASVTQTAETGGLALAKSKSGVGLVVVGDYCELMPPTPWSFSSTTLGATFAYLAAPRTGPTQLRGVSLADATAGVAVGTGASAVRRTANGGVTWTAVSAPHAKNLYAVDLTSATTGYAVGRTAAGTAATVLKTTNGGASWSVVK